MIPTLVIGMITLAVVGWLHFYILSRAVGRVRATSWSIELEHLVVLVLIGALHLAEAGIFTAAYQATRALDLGGFKPDDPLSTLDVYYFSLVNYTTLGLSDTYPTGHMRLLTGIQSVIGFLLLSCSASYLFLLNSDRMQDRKEWLKKAG